MLTCLFVSPHRSTDVILCGWLGSKHQLPTYLLTQFISVQFISIHFTSSPFSSVHFTSMKFISVLFTAFRFNSVHFSPVKFIFSGQSEKKFSRASLILSSVFCHGVKVYIRSLFWPGKLPQVFTVHTSLLSSSSYLSLSSLLTRF